MELNSEIIMFIISLCAILSPILVAIINNHYSLKIKKYENYELKQTQILENFTKHAGAFITDANIDTKSNLLSAFYSLLPYFIISKKDIEEIIDDINNNNQYDYLTDELNVLLPKLAQQIKPKHKSLIQHILDIINRIAN